jgi:hypothetical protein
VAIFFMSASSAAADGGRHPLADALSGAWVIQLLVLTYAVTGRR